MTRARPVSDLEINAYADGELTGEAAESVRDALLTDDAGRLVAAWRDHLEMQLHRAYDPLLARPMSPRIARLLEPRRVVWRPRGMRRAAAAVGIAAAAAVAGFSVGLHVQTVLPDEPTRLAQLGAGAYGIYALDSGHPVEVDGTNRVELGQWLSGRLNVDFKAPDISSTGFTLVGGRLLADGSSPAALLMYEDDAGRRITLYMEKRVEDGETPIRHAVYGGINTYAWVDHPFACAVSGDIETEKLRSVAQKLYAALERRV